MITIQNDDGVKTFMLTENILYFPNNITLQIKILVVTSLRF